MLGSSLAKFFKVDSLISNLTGYVETKIELVKVEAKEELSKGLSKALFAFIVAFVFAIVLVFLSAGIALLLSQYWGPLAGFGIVAGFYVIIGIVLIVLRDNIKHKLEKELRNTLSKKK